MADDSTLFPSGSAYINLAGRMQAKVFMVDDSVNPPQAGWVTLSTLMSGVSGSSGGTSTPSNVVAFSNGSTATFSDGTPITFNS